MRTTCCLLGIVVGFAVTASPARADLWIANSNSADGPLLAEASFAVSNQQIQVTITNLLDPTKIKSAGQALSDLVFTISSAPGKDTGNLAFGHLVNVGSGGSVSSMSGTLGRWIGLEKSGKKILGGFNITGDTITLEAIGGGKPTEMILPESMGGKYTSANSSITKNFSPFVDGPATLTLNLAGVTSSTKITGVTFSFGTGPDYTVTGKPGPPDSPLPVPEPSTLVIAGLGAIGFVAYEMRRRRGRKMCSA
jgi:hypothetical protein